MQHDFVKGNTTNNNWVDLSGFTITLEQIGCETIFLVRYLFKSRGFAKIWPNDKEEGVWIHPKNDEVIYWIWIVCTLPRMFHCLLDGIFSVSASTLWQLSLISHFSSHFGVFLLLSFPLAERLPFCVIMWKISLNARKLQLTRKGRLCVCITPPSCRIFLEFKGDR